MTNEEREKVLFEKFGTDKIGLACVCKVDGRNSKSKVEKILANIGEIKAQELNIIPKMHGKCGNKRLFRLKDVVTWMEK